MTDSTWDRREMARRLRGRAEKLRLIASDLDGTLLYTASDVTDRTLAAIDLARSRGAQFTVCTGRSFYELGDLPRELALTAPVICRNGAEIVDPADGSTLFRQLIPAGESAAFLRFCLQEGIDVCLTTGEAVYFPAEGSFFTNFFGSAEAPPRANAPQVRALEPTLPLEEMEHYKLILVTGQSKYPQARAFLQKCPGIQVTAASGEIDDLVSSRVDKGSGLAWTAAYLGTDRGGCCAFGDFVNDIPMFRYAALSFAMANAAPDVRAAAEFTAPSNGEDGVAQALEALYGI